MTYWKHIIEAGNIVWQPKDALFFEVDNGVFWRIMWWTMDNHDPLIETDPSENSEASDRYQQWLN